MSKRKDWFKPKKYPHIGLPIETGTRHEVENYLRNPTKISQHSFLPLIKRVQVSYRYKSIEGIKKRISKKRPICYASHLDSQIYSFYGQLLEERYESYLIKHGYSDCVIAYRSIPRANCNGNKCNIDLAKDAFDYINAASINKSQIVIIADIKGFFDSLDHKLLKDAWKVISNVESLPDDEYSIFTHITRYAYVNAQELFNMFRSEIICQGKTGITSRKLASMKYFRDKDAIAFCRKENIAFIRQKGMIHKHPEAKGIPQGLPISAVLANMYMWRFDQMLYDFMQSNGGYYRRYSDDIVIVCDEYRYNEIAILIQNLIKQVKLEITPEKTKIYISKYQDGHVLVIDKEKGSQSNIEYLGLSFNGQEILLKNKSISKYYHKMKRTVNAKTSYAINKTDKTGGILFVKQLLRKFTPIGSKRHTIFRRSNYNKSIFFNTRKKSFGNFWTYVAKASKICHSPKIMHQLIKNRATLRKRIIIAKKTIENSRNKKRQDELKKYGHYYH